MFILLGNFCANLKWTLLQKRRRKHFKQISHRVKDITNNIRLQYFKLRKCEKNSRDDAIY